MPRLKEAITFDEGLEILVKRFDEVVARLRAVHEDASFLNDEAREYTDALKELAVCQADIFTLKNVSLTVEALRDAEEESEA